MSVLSSEKFLIKGLGGKKTLEGSVKINGAKNAALKLMAASLLFKNSIFLDNMPNIEDVERAGELLRGLGAVAEKENGRKWRIDTEKVYKNTIDPEVGKRLRASVVFSGPLLARFGKASFPHPGGDVIGERPIDLFLDGFKKMGARVDKERRLGQEIYVLSASRGLKGAEIFFKMVSVTATETLMMAAVLATGKTILRNAAMEPEIKHLADFLSRGGAKIKGAGTSTIEIEGKKDLLYSPGEPWRVIPDRIEAGSFIILGALAGKHLEVKGIVPEHLESLVYFLRDSGVNIEISRGSIIVKAPRNPKAINIKTHEYPGFPTDLQAPMVVYLTQTEGESLVFETIFEGRLAYTEWLGRMGANIEMWDPHRIMVKGPTPLRGRELESPDIRAGLAFVIAAIVGKGESVVHNVYNIDRGYERIEERLKALGVDIVRVS